MKPDQSCPTCGTQIPANDTNGLCPKCLLAEGLSSGGDHGDEAARWDATVDSSAKLKVADRLAAGEEFGEYDLLDEIARGGMGVVYKARHRQLNRVCALKMILSGQLASEQDVERFKREAEAAANLDHSGIVPIYEIGEQGGQHFFSMKLVEGGSLAERLTELRKDTRAIVRLLEQVTRAVHYAHQRGILHRDLKPANILLDEEGNPLITDLGLAKQIQSDSNLTHTGAVVGTPAYMPPEQAAGKKEITTAADICSIGAILYEALTGQPPHKADSPIKTLMQVLESDIAPPRTVDSRVNRKLELICMKCLERDPANRYSSAAALADDLQNWLEGRPVSVRPPSFAAAVGEALQANLRSAVGAAILGLVAGIVFAFCLSKLNHRGDIISHPPDKIYQLLPAEIPWGRLLVFQKVSDRNPFEPQYLLATMGIVLGFGFIVAAVTRAKPGSEAFALGTVGALLMSIAVFATHIGFGAIIQSHAMTRPRVQLLAEAALGPDDQAGRARDQLFKAFTGLEAVASEDRGETIAYRLFYDGIYGAPIGMFVTMVLSALLCMVPTIAGTVFASKLFHERGKLRSIIPVYLEFMCVIVWLAICVCFQTLLPAIGGTVPDAGLVGQWIQQAILYSFLISMAVVVYRGLLWWPWRLLIYVVFTVGFTVIF